MKGLLPAVTLLMAAAATAPQAIAQPNRVDPMAAPSPLDLLAPPPAAAFTSNALSEPVLTNSPRFDGGASLLFIRPRFESNPAYTVSTVLSQGPGNPTRNSRQVSEFDYDFGTAFRTWLSYETAGGYGVRARWFRLDQAAKTMTVSNDPLPLGGPVLARTVAGTSPLLAIGPQTSLPAVFSLQVQGQPGAPAQLTFDSSLRMNAWDVEGTLGGLTLGRASLLFAGGVRFADIVQRYTATLTGLPGQYLVSEQSYYGVGPTLAAEGRTPFERLGISAYGSGRVSLTYGDHRQHTYGTNLGLTPPFDLASHDDTSFRRRFLPTFDFELGVEKRVPLGRASLLVQAGVVGSLWPAGGGAQPNGNMGLFGFVVGSSLQF